MSLTLISYEALHIVRMLALDRLTPRVLSSLSMLLAIFVNFNAPSRAVAQQDTSDSSDKAASLAPADKQTAVKARIKRALTLPPAILGPLQSPCFALHALARIYSVHNNSFKYIWYTGESGRNRLSIYFDGENRLCLRLIDAEGNIAYAGADRPFSFNKWLSLSCIINTTDDNSIFVEIFVNADPIISTRSISGMNIAALSLSNGTLGADIHGDSGAKFDLAELILQSVTYEEQLRLTIPDYFPTKEPKEWTSFDTHQWIRAGSESSQEPPTPPSDSSPSSSALGYLRR